MTMTENSTGSGPDIQTIIQNEIAKAMAGLAGNQPASQSFEDVLTQVDPRDSDAALAMYEWLHKNGRLHVIGQLHGAGYLETYQEPKGATKAGYAPGATTGGRMVDAAVDKAREGGQAPVKKGLCPHCYSAVYKHVSGAIMLDQDDALTKGDGDVCDGSPDGKHAMA